MALRRGFGLEDTRLERTDRVARLLLILSVALHRCVFTGIAEGRSVRSCKENPEKRLFLFQERIKSVKKVCTETQKITTCFLYK